MIFNSYFFTIVFLPFILTLYYLGGKIRKILPQFILFLASLYFYSKFNMNHLLLLLLSGLVNYILAKVISKRGRFSKIIFVCGVIFNLSILGYFKYFNFFISSFNNLLNLNLNILNIIVPVGLSYFTFQQISYLVDTYKCKDYNYSLLNYLTYVLFFGHIISGPIIRHDEFIPQLNNEYSSKPNYENLFKGMSLFILGLSKKVLIADLFGRSVDWAFQNTNNLNQIGSILAVVFFSVQIYFDFSGYSDMVLGIGRMFNIKYPINFNSPYKSKNIDEFWSRWHMTLTRFFTKYVYIPLGGNRVSKLRFFLNILIVFVLSGFWHGANMTFIVWGLLHGIYSIVYKTFKQGYDKLFNSVKLISTFMFVNLTWIYFRSQNLNQANSLVKNILFGNGFKINHDQISNFSPYFISKLLEFLGFSLYDTHLIIMIVFLILALSMIFLCINSLELVDLDIKNPLYIIFLTTLFVLSVLSFSKKSSFIYTNF